MLDQVTAVGERDWLVDVGGNSRRPARHVGRRALAAVKHIQALNAAIAAVGRSGATGNQHDRGKRPERTTGDNSPQTCLLYTSDAADDLLCVDLGGRRILTK